MRRFKISIAAVLFLVVISCSYCYYKNNCFDWEVISPPFTYYFLDENMTESAMFSVEFNSDFYRRIDDWMRRNKDGWRKSFDSYAPKNILRGGGFSFNFINDFVVLNIKNDEYWGQYVKKLGSNNILQFPDFENLVIASPAKIETKKK